MIIDLTYTLIITGISDVSADAFLAALRKESEDGSALKASKFRGVYRSDNGTEWEARIGHDSPLVPWRPSVTSSTSKKKPAANLSHSKMEVDSAGVKNAPVTTSNFDDDLGPASGFMKSMSRSLSK